MTAKKNEVYTLDIQGYGSGGEGVARLDGQAVFVKGVLAGERCAVQLLKVGKSAAWGRVREVLDPSPHRQTPDCPQYPKCGGCALRHMDYEEELRFKRQRVEDALRRIGGWDGRVEVIHGAARPERYRNKIQFPVAQGPKVGFYRARSHDVVDAPDCLLQPLEATRLRKAFRDWMERYQIPAYDEVRHQGLIRHFYVRVNRDGESLCAVVANGERLPKQAALAEALREAEPGLRGLVLSVNREKSNVILGKEYRTLWGQDFLEDTLCGLRFRLSVPSFYQVNREQTEVLYGRALELAGLTGTETVLDLYCGIGTISLCMAKRAKEVVGAEVVPQAVEDARENAKRNGVGNVSFLCADAGEAALALARKGMLPQVVCVDPPRKGLSKDVIQAIQDMGPERVVYVSCDPGTLARDVKLLGAAGFGLRCAEAVDLFPGTGHVETVACLSQQKPDDVIRVGLDLDELEVTPAESKATYGEIKAYVWEKFEMKVSSLYISQIKRKCGLEVGENYNLAKSENARVPTCPPEKEKAIIAALEHFQMIEESDHLWESCGS